MKMFIFLLCTTVFSFNAEKSFSQEKVTIDKTELVKADRVFEIIKKQTNYDFIYPKELFTNSQKVQLKKGEILVTNLLQLSLSNKNLTYEISQDNVIIIKEKPKGVISTILPVEEIQSNEISGKVTDNSGIPLPGVNVVIAGTNVGTETGFDGNYTIKATKGEVLKFSYVGMKAKTITVGTESTINILLEDDAASLDEVIVVGYGVQKKVNLTGAVNVVKSEDIKNRAVSNVSEALQGLAPNLNISASEYSSEAGGTPQFNLRGVGSLNGNDSPYVLIDGIPMDLNTINPEDIQSISVLKDAASAAIYGSKAAFGVILITTKKGSKNGFKINYSSNYSFSSPIGLPHLANTLEYMTAYDQAQINAGGAATYTSADFDRVRQYMAGTITDETSLRDDANDWHGNNIWSWKSNANNDWLHIYYDDMVMRQKHDLSFSGGNEKTTFFLSGSIFDQPDELRYGNQFYKRATISATINSEINKWLSIDFNTKYVSERRQFFNPSNGWGRNVQYHNFYRTNSYRPLFLPNGEYSPISYLPAMIDGGKEKHYDNQLIVSTGINIKLMKDWGVKVKYSYKNNSDRIEDNRLTVVSHNPDGSAYESINGGSSNYSAASFGRTDFQLLNITSSYLKEIGNHNFSLLGGFEFDLTQYNGLYGRKYNLVTSNVPSISTATGEIRLSDTKYHQSSQGYFGRFSYNYDEKYLLEVNARYDGSSRFAKDSRWGFFPSVSAGYNIHKENFWSKIKPIINTLKLRGSWGALGNQNIGDNYPYVETLGIRSNLNWIVNGSRPDYTSIPSLVSPSLTWETSTTTDFGFDATFLNNRLSTSFDYYKRVTSDMFGPAVALPRTLGTNVPRLNNATLETKGFEVSLNWRDKIGDEFYYGVKLNLADNVSTVTKYNNPTKTLSTWYEGRVVGEIWGFETNGLYQTQNEADNGADQSLFWPTWGPGDVAYVDKDGDNVITRGTSTVGDTGDLHKIGNNAPRYTYGINLSAEYKGFDINILLQGVGKRDWSFSKGDPLFFGFNGNQWWGMNVYEQTKDYWRPSDEANLLGANTGGYYPKPYLSREDYKNKERNTRYMQDASYMRLKNITLGYTVPKIVSTKIGIQSARLYLSGENLLTFTKLTDLFDPEGLSGSWGTGKRHPNRKVVAVGLNITF